MGSLPQMNLLRSRSVVETRARERVYACVCVRVKRSDSAMSLEKTRLEADIERLRADVVRLESQLVEAKENARLLVEYPDLHYTGSGVGLTGWSKV